MGLGWSVGPDDQKPADWPGRRYRYFSWLFRRCKPLRLAEPGHASFAMYGGSGLAGVYQSLGIAGVSDGIFTTGTGIETTKLWGLRGGYTHNWDAQWNSALFGAYTSVSYNATARGYICPPLPLS